MFDYLMNMQQESILMTDTEGRGRIEAVMDYILAWTMKMCDKINHKENVNEPLLYECRKILSKLIGIDFLKGNWRIKTYLEWKRIDLTVELELPNGDCHAILIENKVNADLPLSQLIHNKKVFTEHYDNEEGWIQHYWLICANQINGEWKQQCQRDGFKYITLDELSDYNAEDVGNAIFDEFWRRTWE